VSLFGAVFAQFNLDTPSFDLLNADYLVGPELTLRHGRWSGRVRFYHQSSHLGDEFLLNYGIAHGVQRQDLRLRDPRRDRLGRGHLVAALRWRGLVVSAPAHRTSPPRRHSCSGASSCAVPPGSPGTG